jgi:nicotinamidase
MKDYHPPAHISFASRHSREPFTSLQVTDARGKTYDQTLWPDHCVQGTRGAEIDRGLRRAFEPWKGEMKIVRKVSINRLVSLYSHARALGMRGV